MPEMTVKAPAAVRIGELVGAEFNPRKISRARLDQLKAAMAADPAMLWARPVVALLDGTVIMGNQRLRAAGELGWETIPAVLVDLDRETARLWMLRDNNGYGEWDAPTLTELMRELQDAGAELELAGFGPAELQRLLEGEAKAGRGDPDRVPDRTANPTAKEGEVWVLGDHRLAVGDARNLATVIRALGEASHAEMVFTDPPYNVDYSTKSATVSHKAWKDIEGDHQPEHEFREWLTDALEPSAALTISGGAAYVCHPDTGGVLFRQAYQAAGWEPKQILIWVKQHFVLGRQDYQWQHEPIIYGWRPGAAHRWYGAFTKTTVTDGEPEPSEMTKAELVELVRELRNERNTDVIREPRPTASELHPTTKPVALIEHYLANSSQRGDRVLDPFGGSGSTLIAAERRERRCAMVEIDAGYADVIIERWQGYAGGKAKRERGTKAAA